VNEVVGGGPQVRRRLPRHPGARRALSVVWWVPGSMLAGPSRILPDAHIDLVWHGGRLHVAGPDTTARVTDTSPGGDVLGFQVAPGAAAAVLGVPASAVRDDRVDITDLWGADVAGPLVDALHEAPDASVAAELVEAAVAARLDDDPVDPVAAELRRRLVVGARADDLGLGERQLRRRCTIAFGYGPKVLDRVLRFDAFVARLRAEPAVALADLAAELGYADQSHLTHDVGALAGLPPARLRAHLVSDPDKTPGA
jgi:AraC-like DNA-binding protein